MIKRMIKHMLIGTIIDLFVSDHWQAKSIKRSLGVRW